ncbi:MAG: YlbF family regulator [Bacillota bacterium]
MIPAQELKALAYALMQTPEYTQMLRERKKVMENAKLGRQMLSFEKEHAQLINLNFPATDMSARFKKLYQNYKEFLDDKDVQAFIAATRRYQSLISDCITQLNRLLDINNSGMKPR